ncbi:unnamed protein product [Acanthosepion pharaonis]|uniref:Uncharacterized protein n=1 Tax=Acanthosepion pharaonis TaxID=158019 RepID=A0A812EHY0_ACAPH|nr:unnamed protein product [Sepia pharaonis]
MIRLSRPSFIFIFLHINKQSCFYLTAFTFSFSSSSTSSSFDFLSLAAPLPTLSAFFPLKFSVTASALSLAPSNHAACSSRQIHQRVPAIFPSPSGFFIVIFFISFISFNLHSHCDSIYLSIYLSIYHFLLPYLFLYIVCTVSASCLETEGISSYVYALACVSAYFLLAVICCPLFTGLLLAKDYNEDDSRRQPKVLRMEKQTGHDSSGGSHHFTDTVVTLKFEERISAKTKRTMTRLATVIAYIFSVSLPAFILAVYYISFWNHEYPQRIAPKPPESSTVTH